ncbi:MAG TPA: hypothetical protein VKP69_09640 [Isosphaeraceae bacterium]|nr:hypothetical protein [Isosphaeraceae bacterium]
MIKRTGRMEAARGRPRTDFADEHGAREMPTASYPKRTFTEI